jgi:hypothetical protein
MSLQYIYDLFLCLFVTIYDHIPVSPLISYSIRFVQHGFTKLLSRNVLPMLDEGLLYV